MDNDYRMATRPTPPPRENRNGSQTAPPYRNEAPPPKRKQETADIRQTEPYRAPRHDDPLAPMGMQIATADLKMGCALLVEVDETTLQGHIRDRTTLEDKQNRNRQPQTEKQEVGSRAMALRISMFNYIANSQVSNTSKTTKIRHIEKTYHKPP